MALTQQDTLTAETFDAIMAEMLIKADDEFLFLREVIPQAPSVIDAGAKTMTFNQPDLPTGTYSETSRRLTEGTAINAGSQAITMSTKTLTLREYGGPHDGSNVVPFGITEKMLKMAKHDLAALLGGFMRRDRNKFVNKRRMDDLLSTTNIVTPDGEASGTIASGVKASAAWMRALNKQMKDSLIIPFPNGRWKLILTTKDERDLKADPDISDAFKFFAQANPIVARGQIGVYENFDIFVDTLLPTTGVGAGSAITGYQSLAFGPYHLGEGVLMPASPRMADDTDFGRQMRMLWLSLEATGLLYGDYVVKGITT